MTWKCSSLVHQLKSEWHKGCDFGLGNFFSKGTFIAFQAPKITPFPWEGDTFLREVHWFHILLFSLGCHNGLGGRQLFPSARRSRHPTDQVKTNKRKLQSKTLTNDLCGICNMYFLLPSFQAWLSKCLSLMFPLTVFFKGKRIWNGEKIIF